MRHRQILAAALISAAAVPAMAVTVHKDDVPITVQNCMYDGHTHEFVVYPDTDTQDVHEQEKRDIPHGSSAVLACTDQRLGIRPSSGTCLVKVHGSNNKYAATSAITFYANRKVNNFVDADCSREHSAGEGESQVDDAGDNMP